MVPQATPAMLLFLAALLLVPGAHAQGIVEPMACVHDLVNTCSVTPPMPATPVGAGLLCDHTTGEVGGEVHVGPSSTLLCYRVDPAPASCGGASGIGVVENGVEYAQCVDPGTCPGLGARTDASLDDADHALCVDPAAVCGIQASGQVGATPIYSCTPSAYVDTDPCPGMVGTKVTVGHPFTGDLVDVCL